MKIDVLTLFPEMFQSPFEESIFKRAADKNLVRLEIHNFRDFSHDKHHAVDDSPYGGGAGMLLKPEPLFEAVEAVMEKDPTPAPVILLSPQGRTFNQSVARELAGNQRLIIICGHYEGFDERVREHLATDEISIGDFVLTGGELAAMVVIDTVSRLIPGVLGSEDSSEEDSHSNGLLEHPHYTRPPVFRGWGIPEVLLSGNHARIDRWRRKESLRRTLKRRPDMLEKITLSKTDRKLMDEILAEENPKD
ncbi:tRNA (guanosine(37)-N1)-methyltransferase TrmD [Dehalococcoides mccartyi]|uniref:tRNA (guanine-N(1)-)-methyltransferase n=1 Tax=Dehalococcoides mccartyi (strain VS) TaxID=311424 RepID=D2BGJ1_DEHMV|nr:tRNA (guanosine(37)-N1)-methyltransferase TrmD [Dehalococcoides mccartyi]ACZ61441.1 tRNA (guanine-N1)-methyltransferase [Dehalococcoides mccartyi VS]AHB13050.1 tRNA (guanine-N1)-methyltransferase [Dehalococcoides mccartyi GY50]AII57494.1 tRNA (guanine-N1)-methyltransferase [Dehalococcoides mccartyi CG1]APH11989.1 tRNA (guanine-N1)-methyltransferase [Dehalococcoides mccartyi]